MFSAVPKPDVDFVTDLVKQQTDEFLKNFATFLSGLVNQLMLSMFLQIFLLTCQKKKYQNLNYWLEGKTITNSGITTRKELLQPQNLILFWPTGGLADMWSLCQNISELSFNNPDLPTLKYFQTIEIEAANQFFELMKKKQKFCCYFRVWFIFGQNKLFYWRKPWSPNVMLPNVA